LAPKIVWRHIVSADLGSLRGALKLICPVTDWSWLQSIANRIAVAAPRPARKYNLVTSERLYALGIELMVNAVNAADAVGRAGTRHAIQYRDGLIISVLALIARAANRASSHKSRRSLGARHTGRGYQDQATSGLFNSEGVIGAH
jgi:hypothetical protein